MTINEQCRDAVDPERPCEFAERCTVAHQQHAQLAGARGMNCVYFEMLRQETAYDPPREAA